MYESDHLPPPLSNNKIIARKDIIIICVLKKLKMSWPLAFNETNIIYCTIICILLESMFWVLTNGGGGLMGIRRPPPHFEMEVAKWSPK